MVITGNNPHPNPHSSPDCCCRRRTVRCCNSSRREGPYSTSGRKSVCSDGLRSRSYGLRITGLRMSANALHNHYHRAKHNRITSHNDLCIKLFRLPDITFNSQNRNTCICDFIISDDSNTAESMVSYNI